MWRFPSEERFGKPTEGTSGWKGWRALNGDRRLERCALQAGPAGAQAHPVLPVPAASSACSFPRAAGTDSMAHVYQQSNVCMVPFQGPPVLYGTCHRAWVSELFHRSPQHRPKYSGLIAPIFVLGDSVSPLEKWSVSLLKRVGILLFMGKIF